MPASLRLDFMIGLPLEKRGPTYTAARLAEAMEDNQCRSHIYTPLDRWPLPGLNVPVTSGALASDRLFNRIPYRVSRSMTNRVAEGRLLKAASSADGRHIVFTWSEVSLRLARKLHDRGIVVVREKTNCGKLVSKRILDRAYRRLGVEPAHSITDAMIAKEHEELHLADAVFCPNEMVAQTLREAGIADDKLIATSYGWEPERFTGDDRALAPAQGPTFLFVGYICVRKGADILLEAWEKAGVRGRLVLVGKIEPLIAERCRHVLSRDDVQYFPFTPNVGALYRSADWFVFPSLEEGGPQVTYEAGGCGVPGLVSPMGGGAFTRDGIDGVIVDSDNSEIWAQAIARVAEEPTLQRHYGENARERSKSFTWSQVGAQRRQALLDRYAAG